MKIKKKIRMILCLILVGILLFDANAPVTAYAKDSIQAPKLSSWKDVTDPNQEGDGVTYRITWKPVEGATSYQIKYYECESQYDEGNWYIYTTSTKKCKAEISFSSVYKFKIKVRTVKNVNGKTIYSKWTTSKTKTMHYD